MDKSAIQAITELAQGATAPYINMETPFQTIPKDWKLESLEPYLHRPIRHRNTYTTGDLDSFISYIGDQESNNSTSVIYIDPDEMAATAILDHGTPEAPSFGAHRAILAMKKTPEFQALLNRNCIPFTQQDFIDWVQDWEPILTFQKDGKPVEIKQVLAAVRRLTITAKRAATSQVSDYKTEKTALQSVEIEADDKLALPDTLTMTCAQYDSLEETRIDCRMYARTGDEPQILYRIIGLERHMKDAAEQLQARISAETPSLIYLGTVIHQGK